jgi:predicted PurR-regulated permease PerM
MKTMEKPFIWAAWVVVIWGMSQAKPFLIPILLAALLSFLMNPLIQILEKRKLPEWASIFISAGLLFLPVFLVVGLLLKECSVLIKDYPHMELTIKSFLENLATAPIIQSLNLAQYLDLNSLASSLSDDLGQSVVTVLSGLKVLAEVSTHLLIILVFSVLMLASRKQLKEGVEKILGDTPDTLNQIINLIEKFLITRIGIATLVVILDFVILKLFGTQYSVLFSVLLGFSTFIPVVGFLLGILPPVVTTLALGTPTSSILIMTALLYFVSLVEGHIATPKLLGRQLNLNLFVTFLGLFAGELIWGMWGMVLSVPILGIIRIILSSYPKYEVFSELMEAKPKVIETQKEQNKY